MKKLYSAFTTLLVALVVILALLLVGARFAGFRLFTVLSGSMEPLYPVGSLLYVRSVDPAELQVGDVITYLISEDTVVTHRIVAIEPDEEDPAVLRFATKGDANNAVDGGLVHYRNILGTPVYCIPKLGYVASFIRKPPGLYFAAAAAALLLLLVFLPDLIEDETPEGEKKKKAKQHR